MSETTSLLIDVDQGPRKRHNESSHNGGFDAKLLAFIVIGGLTFLYVLGELGVALYVNSLVLLSDGFHNLGDVLALYIAFWAQRAKKREFSDTMSYGWARTEILGGLTNGMFLISLCLYVVLESITKFIEPTKIESGWLFVITAGAGLTINAIGTIVFLASGQSHGHSHSHDHGHGHGHGHDHGKKKKKKKAPAELNEAFSDSEDKLPLKTYQSSPEIEVVEEGHSHSHGHGHSHSHKKDKKDKEHKHKEGKKHSHEHGHSHKKDKKKKHKAEDLNLKAVLLHYLGDTISSFMVLGAGLLLHYFPDHKWTLYIDPVSSLVIVLLILVTTVPLVKRCAMILLQSTPGHIDHGNLRSEIQQIPGIINVHDFHMWQLVDGMTITSVHIAVEEGCEFTTIVSQIKEIFHEHGIHSSAIQPEFVPRNHKTQAVCEQNCVDECEEDWCCKNALKNRKKPSV